MHLKLTGTDGTERRYRFEWSGLFHGVPRYYCRRLKMYLEVNSRPHPSPFECKAYYDGFTHPNRADSARRAAQMVIDTRSGWSRTHKTVETQEREARSRAADAELERLRVLYFPHVPTCWYKRSRK